MDPENTEWRAQMTFNIEGVRALHSHLEYALRTWPGSPARPEEEQLMLMNLKSEMFAMRMDYNMLFLEARSQD